MKKILVTGATGFIGNYVIENLLQQGHHVIASSSSEDKAKAAPWYAKVKYLPLNLKLLADHVNYYTYFDSPDAMIHLAWEGLPNYNAGFHVQENLPRHYHFLRNLIQNGLKDITVTGTCLEYGMKEGCLAEYIESEPANPYAIAKNELRKKLAAEKNQHPFYLKWIRLFYMYGKGQHSASLMSQLDKALQAGDPIFNMSGGEQERDFLPVEKVADNIVTIALQNNITNIINCCSGEPVTVKQFVKDYLKKENKNIQLNLGYYPYTNYEPMKFWGDDKKLKTVTMIKCPLTGSDNVTVIYTQKSVPLIQNKVYPTKEEARNARCIDVTLAQSLDNGFVFSAGFNDTIIDYDQHYQNEQSNSVYFQQHLSHVIDIMNENNCLTGKVVEIGCGKAYFLNMLAEKGVDITGFDPTYEGDSPSVIKDFFSDKYSNVEADFIILRHTLEHISAPFKFIKTVAAANNYKGKIFIEVPTFDWIVEHNATEDIFYEHCNYFTLDTLQMFFNKSVGGHFFNGQYIYVIADLADVKDDIAKKTIVPYQVKFEERIATYTDLVNSSNAIAIWGAGAKGSTFLNLIDKAGDKVKCVIDINPKKQNRYIGGTGHQIIEPGTLQKGSVEEIIVMNNNYIDEIKSVTQPLGIRLKTL